MKIYMYSHDEAIKNNCRYVKNPIGEFIIFLVVFIIFFHIAIFTFSFLVVYASKFVALLSWIIFVVFSVIWFTLYIKNIKMKNWSAQIAFIKDEDTLWAVKLTYLHFPVIAVTNNLVTTVLTAKPAIDSAITNERMKKEIKERKVYPESYLEALIDAQGKAKIMKDIDKNFTFIFNGRESVIRLDDIKFVKETNKTEVYSYKNYKGKVTELEVIKAYPGLKEEVFNTKPVNHEIPFPHFTKKYKEKISANPLYVFLILMGIFVILPYFILIIYILFSY